MMHLVVWHFICLKSYFNEVFNCQDGYFNGYFSNKKITDLKDDYIASTITQDDLTKVSRQLNVSMGEMFYLVEGFAIDDVYYAYLSSYKDDY